jgi:hypothetical protein
MALSASTVWEVRTAGDAANGGGYTTGGTDYSQQDAAQLSLTDLACLDTSTNLTSVTGGFTSAMVGNIIYIASGTQFTAGYYEIKTYVDTNTITIDRTAAVSGQNATAGVGKVGGATNHPNTISAVVLSGNVIYIKAGTYQPVGANAYVATITVGGSAPAFIDWIGYNTTRTDEPTGNNRPLLDANSAATRVLYIPTAGGNRFQNLRMANSTAEALGGLSGFSAINTYRNCRITNAGGRGLYSYSSQTFVGCEIDNNGSAGVQITGGSNRGPLMISCYVHDNAGTGAAGTSTGSVSASNCVFDSNAGHGVTTDVIMNLDNCIAYKNTGATSDGFSWTSSTATSARIYNCSSVSNGRYGFSSSGGKAQYFDFNNYYGHGTEVNGFVLGANDTGDVDPKFNDPDNGDFTLQSGSPCLNTGLDANTYSGVTV